MFARSISPEVVRSSVEGGEVIASYDDDAPFPSELLLGFLKDDPLHAVLAYDAETQTGYVITTYVPDLAIWDDEFRTRRRP